MYVLKEIQYSLRHLQCDSLLGPFQGCLSLPQNLPHQTGATLIEQGQLRPCLTPQPYPSTTLLQTRASGTSVEGQWPLSSKATLIVPAASTDTRVSANLTVAPTGLGQSQRLA